MKGISLFLSLVVFSFSCAAQYRIKLVRLWQKPEVHLIYREYHVFFTIKDINTTMKYLHELNPRLYDSTSGLDTSTHYSLELVAGRDMQYMNNMQPLIQKYVGAFLLLRGHAYIETSDHKKVPVILEEAGPEQNTGEMTFVPMHFYDAKTGKEIFAGIMNTGLQYKYLEL